MYFVCQNEMTWIEICGNGIHVYKIYILVSVRRILSYFLFSTVSNWFLLLIFFLSFHFVSFLSSFVCMLLFLFLFFSAILRPSAVKCAFPFISPVKHEDDNLPNKLDHRQNRLTVSIGPCKWIFNEMCPNSDIKFYLYTRKNPQDRQLIYADGIDSNLSNSNFNPSDPTKIILHGYNSDMFLTPLIQMKGGR